MNFNPLLAGAYRHFLFSFRAYPIAQNFGEENGDYAPQSIPILLRHYALSLLLFAAIIYDANPIFRPSSSNKALMEQNKIENFLLCYVPKAKDAVDGYSKSSPSSVRLPLFWSSSGAAAALLLSVMKMVTAKMLPKNTVILVLKSFVFTSPSFGPSSLLLSFKVWVPRSLAAEAPTSSLGCLAEVLYC